MAPTLAGPERTHKIGQSSWHVFPVQETLDCAAAIRAQPELTRCDDPACERCHDAALGGPSTDVDFEKLMVRSWR